MSQEFLVISVAADDRPGVIQALSDTALAHQANWLESSLSHLCGQFVGIVKLGVQSADVEALQQALTGLAHQGIAVQFHDQAAAVEGAAETVELYVEANDRPGIIEEITSTLARLSINIEQLETWCESASMAGYDLFIAQLAVSLPADVSRLKLEQALEGVSDDLMVTIEGD